LLAIEVHGIREVLPDTGDALHFCLASQLAFGSDLAGHARHFGGERVELLDHGVDRVFQLEDLALDVHRNLARQVAVGDSGRDLRDVANLGRQVARHRVDTVRKVLPDASHALHIRLAAELAFGPDFASYARDLVGEAIELIDHRVHDSRGVEELSLECAAVHLEVHGLGQIAFRDRTDDARDFGGGPDQVANELVHGVDACRPATCGIP